MREALLPVEIDDNEEWEMNRDTLSVKRLPVSFIALALAFLLPLACSSSQDAAGPDDTQGPGDPNPTITAGVVVSDASQMSGFSGVDAVDGEVSFSGLTVEISEDGVSWLTVTDQPTTATLALGDGAAQATLVPTTDIPAGDYTTARFTATAAQVDITATLNGQAFAAQLSPPGGQPIVIEKDIQVIDNGDGTRTISVELVTVQTFALRVTPGAGITIEIGGDIGAIGAAAAMSAAVVASDVSAPAGVDVGGEVTFTNLTIELSDDGGQSWLKVAEQQGTATVALGDGTVEATLVPVDQIPAGLYTMARLTATDVTVDLTAMINGQQFAAQFKPPTTGPVEITKDVEAIANADGTTTFRFELEMVRTIQLRQGAGGMELVINGDLGDAAAPASMAAAVAARDASAPAGASVSGDVTFTGLTIELFDDATQTWLIVAQDQGTATVALADKTVDATLIPVDQIPAGMYTMARLTAVDALIDVTVDSNGQQVHAQIRPPTNDPVEITKDVEAIDNGDGTTTFRFELEMIRTIDVGHDPVSGATVVTVDGDLGVSQARAS